MGLLGSVHHQERIVNELEGSHGVSHAGTASVCLKLPSLGRHLLPDRPSETGHTFARSSCAVRASGISDALAMLRRGCPSVRKLERWRRQKDSRACWASGTAQTSRLQQGSEEQKQQQRHCCAASLIRQEEASRNFTSR